MKNYHKIITLTTIFSMVVLLFFIGDASAFSPLSPDSLDGDNKASVVCPNVLHCSMEMSQDELTGDYGYELTCDPDYMDSRSIVGSPNQECVCWCAEISGEPFAMCQCFEQYYSGTWYGESL